MRWVFLCVILSTLLLFTLFYFMMVSVTFSKRDIFLTTWTSAVPPSGEGTGGPRLPMYLRIQFLRLTGILDKGS